MLFSCPVVVALVSPRGCVKEHQENLLYILHCIVLCAVSQPVMLPAVSQTCSRHVVSSHTPSWWLPLAYMLPPVLYCVPVAIFRSLVYLMYLSYVYIISRRSSRSHSYQRFWLACLSSSSLALPVDRRDSIVV